MDGEEDTLELTRKLALVVNEFYDIRKHSFTKDERNEFKTALSTLFVELFGFTRGLKSVLGIQRLETYPPGPMRSQEIEEALGRINAIRNQLLSNPRLFATRLSKSLVMILYWLKFYEELLVNDFTKFPADRLIEMRKDFRVIIKSVFGFAEIVPDYYSHSPPSINPESAGRSVYSVMSDPNLSRLLNGSFSLEDLLKLKGESSKAPKTKKQSLNEKISTMDVEEDDLNPTRKLVSAVNHVISSQEHLFSEEDCRGIKETLSKLFKLFGFTPGLKFVFGIKILDAYPPGPLRSQKKEETKKTINEIRNELLSNPSIFVSPLFKSMVMILYWLKFYEELLVNDNTQFPEDRLIEMRKDFRIVIKNVFRFTKVVPDYYVTREMRKKELELFYKRYKSTEELRTFSGWHSFAIRNLENGRVDVNQEIEYVLIDLENYRTKYLELMNDASVAGTKYEKLMKVNLIYLDTVLQMCKETNGSNAKEINVLLKEFTRMATRIYNNTVLSDYYNVTGRYSIPK